MLKLEGFIWIIKKLVSRHEFRRLWTNVDPDSVDNDTDAKSRVHKYGQRRRPTWLVRPGEDLCKLAKHLFHDAKLGWLIADINAPNINEVFDGRKRIIELHVRQKIELPVWQDVVEFYKLENRVKTSDIITVVK